MLLLVLRCLQIVLLTMQFTGFSTSKSKFDRFLTMYSVFDTVNIFFVFIVFWTMLSFTFVYVINASYSQKWSLTLSMIFNICDHLIVPVFKVIDLFFFTPLDFDHKLLYKLCILYPLIYYIFSTIRGLLSPDHMYPYWFMDPTKISYPLIILWFCILLCAFIFFTWVFIRLCDLIKNKRERRALLPDAVVSSVCFK